MGGKKSKPQPPPTTTYIEEKPMREPPREPPRREPPKEYTTNPWRSFGPDFNWDQNTEATLKKDLKEFKTDQKVTNFRVLLLGAVGAGKSSFINSIASIDKGRLAQVALAGTGKKSKTTKLREFMPTNIIEHVILSDTMGIEAIEQEGFNVQDVVYLINGNIPLDYQFNPRCPVDPSKCESFKENPDDSDKSHCVAFVIDVQVIVEENIPARIKAKITELQDKIDKLEVPAVVLLTHIDSQCEDPQKTFFSIKLENAVKTASEMFGIPELYIFPVKNYSSEGSLDPMKNILHLLALKQMMYFATDFLEMTRHNAKSTAVQTPKETRTNALSVGQNVSARFKEESKDKLESWHDGQVAEIIIEGQCYNIDFGGGIKRYLNRTDIKPK